MKLSSNQPAAVTERPDWTFRLLVAALFTVACWLLAMPFVPTIARCTMQRFHLQTDSFAMWAIQQPIPPMYSFANTTEVWNGPPNQGQAPAGKLDSQTVNHFPTRMFSFADGRARFLRDSSSKWFVLRSAYRGRSVSSVYRLDRVADSGWTATLIKENGS